MTKEKKETTIRIKKSLKKKLTSLDFVEYGMNQEEMIKYLIKFYEENSK